MMMGPLDVDVELMHVTAHGMLVTTIKKLHIRLECQFQSNYLYAAAQASPLLVFQFKPEVNLGRYKLAHTDGFSRFQLYTPGFGPSIPPKFTSDSNLPIYSDSYLTLQTPPVAKQCTVLLDLACSNTQLEVV
jgi:hypothetical protein